MIKVIYTLKSSKIAGTENSLLLITDLLKDKIIPYVIIPEKGPIEEELKKGGISYSIIKKRFQFDLLYIVKIYFILKRIRPDIFHHHSSRFDTIPAWILKIKTVERSNMSRDRDGLFINKFSFFDNLTSKLIDHIICVSEDLKQTLIKRGIPEKKITVIYNGVNFNRFYPIKYKPKHRTPLLGIFGRLHPQKGHIYFFKALNILKMQKIDFEVIVVGEGSLLNELQKYIKSINLDSVVDFLGFQSNMNYYYNLCDIIIVPSIWEPLPNIILEAMAAGKPVIASNVGGISEILHDNYTGLLVDAKNPDEIANAIKHIILNKKLTKQLSKNAIEFAQKNFSLDNMADSTLKVYSDLLKRK